MPSTARLRSSPNDDELTLVRVSVDSVRLWPVRLRSFLYMTTSVGDVDPTDVTVSRAFMLEALPAAFVTVTPNVEPSSATVTAGVV